MMRKQFDIALEYSDRKDKRYAVTVTFSGKNITIHFGSPNYENYTIHKDHNRKINYLKRHAPREDWTISGISSAGFWSRWLLWNKPSIDESLKDMEKRFPVRFVSGVR
jgi:hypothetical protein